MTTATWPYRKADDSGGWLEVREPREGDPAGSGCVITTGPQGFAPDLMEIPEITAAMYVAHGHAPPVILGRPEVDLAEGVHIGPLRAWLEFDGEVTVVVGTAQSSIKPHQLRQFAAAAVALADAAESPEPDPAEVGELAAVIRAEIHPDAERLGLRPAESDMIAARAALRWMREREARHG